jgi:putative endonuclease
MPYYVYILQCADGSYYTGNTTDLNRRLWEHQTGADRKAYTFSRRPVALVWHEQLTKKEDALRLEHQIKGWSRKKKRALIEEDFGAIHQIVTEERKQREGKKKR